MKKLFLTVLLIVSCVFQSTVLLADSRQANSQHIVASLENQKDAWNHGDVKAFMSAYLDSDATLYVSKKGVVRGYQSIRKNYLQRYTNKAEMGVLTYSNLQVLSLSDQYSLVIGQWFLQRAKAAGGNVGGYFTLLFTKTKQGWKIAVDHTS